MGFRFTKIPPHHAPVVGEVVGEESLASSLFFEKASGEIGRGKALSHHGRGRSNVKWFAEWAFVVGMVVGEESLASSLFFEKAPGKIGKGKALSHHGRTRSNVT